MDAPEFVKLGLPGERPWAEVVTRFPDGTILAKVANRTSADMTDQEMSAFSRQAFGVDEPLPRLHNHKFNDLVVVRLGDRGLYELVIEPKALQ